MPQYKQTDITSPFWATNDGFKGGRDPMGIQETCQGTVPVALWIIGESTSFEDAVRKAMSLGADADTLGAIVGSIAEAIWGIPEELRQGVMPYLTDEMKEVVNKFYRLS